MITCSADPGVVPPEIAASSLKLTGQAPNTNQTPWEETRMDNALSQCTPYSVLLICTSQRIIVLPGVVVGHVR
jgi:hypothetical protein